MIHSLRFASGDRDANSANTAVDSTARRSASSVDSSDNAVHDYTTHGTGSVGHRVNGSFGSSFTSGSPGRHFDPVWDPRFSCFRQNAQYSKRTFEMLKWQVIVRCLLLDCWPTLIAAASTRRVRQCPRCLVIARFLCEYDHPEVIRRPRAKSDPDPLKTVAGYWKHYCKKTQQFKTCCVTSTLHLSTETHWDCQSFAQSAIKPRAICSFDITSRSFLRQFHNALEVQQGHRCTLTTWQNQ